MIPYIKQYLTEAWDDFDLGQKPDDLLFIKFSDRMLRPAQYGVISFKVNALYKGHEEPKAIIRVPRYPASNEANDSIRIEHSNLRFIHSKINDIRIKRSIPRSLFDRSIRGSLVGAVEYLSGNDMSNYMVCSKIDDLFVSNYKSASKWLIDFQKKLCPENEIIKGAKFSEDHLKSLFDRYSLLFPDKKHLHEGYFTGLVSLANTFDGMQIMLPASHGDYHASNIFMSDGSISGVIDWEDFSAKQLPAFDIYHFITTYFEALYDFSANNYPKGIETFSESKYLLDLIDSFADEYFTALGMDTQFQEIIFPLFMIDSLCKAADPRKPVSSIVIKKEFLLNLRPAKISDLIRYMAIFPYLDLLKKASRSGDKQKQDYFTDKIEKLKEEASSKEK
ncbi:MAG: phosphotransferase [Candidatus Saganbacteria bacterium]|nr:phosphotransferase [Candidatus Saganbacteria bacterium]